MDRSPSESARQSLQSPRLPTPGPYDGVSVAGLVVDGVFKLKVPDPDWGTRWWRFVGVVVERTTAGSVRDTVVNDRPRWFWIPGALPDQLSFSAPGCGVPASVRELFDTDALVVMSQAIPNEHARCMSATRPDNEQVLGSARPSMVLQVRPTPGHRDPFEPVYFTLPSDGIVPHGHVPTGRDARTYLAEVFRAWLPAGSAEIVPITPEREADRYPIAPKVPEGTPVIHADDFANLYSAIAWPRGARVHSRRVIFPEHPPEPYEKDVYPAVAVTPRGEQHHVAILFPEDKSPEIRARKARRESENTERFLENEQRSMAKAFDEALSSIGEFNPGLEKTTIHGAGKIQRPKSAPVGSNVHAKWGQRRLLAGKR